MDKYDIKVQVISMFFGSVLFFLVIPFFIIMASFIFDTWSQLPRFTYGVINLIFSFLILIIPGLLFAAWAIQAQFVFGKGTPVPMLPPQKLVSRGPYKYCRNPMVLGELLFYLGLAIWLGSISAVLLVLFLAIYLLIQIKVVDEKKLEKRFGLKYIEYKKTTPFIIPHFWRKQQ